MCQEDKLVTYFNGIDYGSIMCLSVQDAFSSGSGSITLDTQDI